jgi:hypothetical protein
MRYLILIALQILLASSPLMAGGIRGLVKNERGEPLPFATIFIIQTGSGTATNEDGYYEITLDPGRYDISYQYLGYESKRRQVSISQDFLTENITLVQQVLELSTVEITDGREDPAYTIIRKAIAKASYHRQQVENYTARVYVKGSGRLLDAPRFLRKALQEEGFDSTMAFLVESVSEINYQRPNTYREQVISIRKQGNDQAANPMPYIQGSFYESELADGVSPLSTRAFAYYRFEFEGSYLDRDYEINKIRVIPRNPGEGVFEGTIYIVEDYWSIHSLSLATNKLGFRFRVEQNYAPIDGKAWMPVTHRFLVSGKIIGFRFEYNYLAAVSNYRIQLNRDLKEEFDLVDENIEVNRAREVEQKNKARNFSEREKLASGEELTRKELREAMKAYAKEEKKKQEEPRLESDYTFAVDSNAQNRDTQFWESIRPIPLTAYEVKSYQRVDSLAVVEKEKSEEQKEKSTAGKFDLMDLAIGDTYKLGDRATFRLGLLAGGLNTVEGYTLANLLGLNFRLQDSMSLKLGVTPRYAFGRERFSAKGYVQFGFGQGLRSSAIRVEGGRYIFQVNEDNPISEFVNSFYTLWLERNYMKLFEKDYLELTWNQSVRPGLRTFAQAEVARRYELDNVNLKPWIDSKKRTYSNNQPVNDELADTGFGTNDATKITFGIEWRPWLRFGIRNGRKYAINSSSPTFRGRYTKGLPGVFGSQVNFDLLELGARHHIEFDGGSILNLRLQSGTFVNNASMAFLDYRHFPGNRTIFSSGDPVEQFRLLEYYRHSTRQWYLQGHAHHQFRKLLLTQIPEVWLLGMKENLFVNFLRTPTLNSYIETGYAIDNIFRFLRLEAVTSFRDFRFDQVGLRLSVSSVFGVNFNAAGDEEANSISIGL